MVTRLLTGVLFIFLFASCSTVNVDYHMPSTFLLSPETQGEAFKSGEVGMNINTAHKVSLARTFEVDLFNLTDGASVDTNNEITSSFGIGLKGSLGLWDRIDLYGHSNHDATSAFGFKVQVYGDSLRLKSEGLKIAIAIGYGSGEESEGNDINLKNTNSGNSFEAVNAKIKLKNKEAILLIGQRLSERLLLYTNIHYIHFDVDSTLKTGSGGVFDLSTSSIQKGVNLGLVFHTNDMKPGIKLTAEAGYSMAKLRLGGWHDHMSLGGQATLFW